MSLYLFITTNYMYNFSMKMSVLKHNGNDFVEQKNKTQTFFKNPSSLFAWKKCLCPTNISQMWTVFYEELDTLYAALFHFPR